jgi:Rieske Fe-S protein
VSAGGLLASNLIQIGCGNDVQPAPLVSNKGQKTPLYSVLAGVVTFPNPATHTLADFPDLAPVGGAITIDFPPLDILVVHLGDNQYVAMQSNCPHAGCPLGFSQRDGLIECPCHGSRFHTDGSVSYVEHGPAMGVPLLYRVMQTPTDGTALTLTIDTNAGCGTVDATLMFADHPNLQVAGGSELLMPPAVPCSLLAMRVSTTELVVIDAICTHMQCTVAFNAANNDVECPCHGSVYATDGTVTHPVVAGQASLKKYTVTLGTDSFRIQS